MAGNIHRQKKNRDFVTIDTHCLRNKDLRWDAKGLHSYLMQLPDDWKINVADLEKRSLDRHDGTMSPMRALIAAGYVFRERISGEKGRFVGYDYHLFERPEQTVEWLTVNGKSVNGKSTTSKVLKPLSEVSKDEEGERTPPAPNPSNLKEEKKENGFVAPRRDPHQWQGQIIGPPAEYIASDPVYWKPVPESEKESPSDKLSTKNVSLSVKAEIPPLPKVAPKGIPPFGDSTSEPGPLANFSDREILAMEAENAACWAKIIDPALPGVTLVEAAPKTIQPWEHPNPQSPKELKTVLLRYADQNPENWRDNVLESGRATNWPAEKIDECLTDFCAWQFQQDSTKGKLSQYTAGFSLWLKRQPRYDSMNAPKEGSPTRNAQQSQKANLNHWGANPGGYEEKQAF